MVNSNQICRQTSQIRISNIRNKKAIQIFSLTAVSFFISFMIPITCANSAVFQILNFDCDSKSRSFDQIPSMVNVNATATKGTSFTFIFYSKNRSGTLYNESSNKYSVSEPPSFVFLSEK